MCGKNCCTNTTRHAIIFLFILSILLLINSHNLYFPLPKTNHRPPPLSPPPTGGDSPSLPPCVATSGGTIAVTAFLYGVLFTSITFFIIIISNHSPNDSTIDQAALQVPSNAAWSMFVGSTNMTAVADCDNSRRSGDGVGSDLLKSLPTFAYSSKKQQMRMGKGMKICVICQTKYKDGEMLRWLPECDHLFHMVCIDEWLVSHKTCPCCRADLEFLPGEIYCYDDHVFELPF